MKIPSILFLCSGNSARSQMAEGYLKSILTRKAEVESAGSEPRALHPLAVGAMKELGIDISHHRSKSVEVFSGRTFDYVITVCNQAREYCPFLAARVKRIHWDLEDPVRASGSRQEKLRVFRKVRDEVISRIQTFLIEELNFDFKKVKSCESLSR